jgi:hypothetical protein
MFLARAQGLDDFYALEPISNLMSSCKFENFERKSRKVRRAIGDNPTSFSGFARPNASANAARAGSRNFRISADKRGMLLYLCGEI